VHCNVVDPSVDEGIVDTVAVLDLRCVADRVGTVSVRVRRVVFCVLVAVRRVVRRADTEVSVIARLVVRRVDAGTSVTERRVDPCISVAMVRRAVRRVDPETVDVDVPELAVVSSWQ
jgi:hypothetical protein